MHVFRAATLWMQLNAWWLLVAGKGAQVAAAREGRQEARVREKGGDFFLITEAGRFFFFFEAKGLEPIYQTKSFTESTLEKKRKTTHSTAHNLQVHKVTQRTLKEIKFKENILGSSVTDSRQCIFTGSAGDGATKH